MPRRSKRALGRRRRKSSFPHIPTYTPSEATLDFAAKITSAWQKAVASIIETGQLLIQAKRDLTYGQFASLFDDPPSGDWGASAERRVPFSQRTAERLMKIARNGVLEIRHMCRNLPASWGTLYVLTCIPEKRLEELIEQGKVHPGLIRRDAERLIGKVVFGRLAGAIKVLVAAMGEHRHQTEALVANLRQVLDEEQWGPFYHLDRLSAWIAGFDAAWKQADRKWSRKKKQATKAYIEDKVYGEDDEDDDDADADIEGNGKEQPERGCQEADEDEPVSPPQHRDKEAVTT